MSLVVIQWPAGHSDEEKLKIRADISQHFSEIAQAPAKFFMVNFSDLPGIDYDTVFNDVFIWVYATEGHSKERKEQMCAQFTEDISKNTSIDKKKISFFFVDISKGNMGSGGKIVNYLGLVADLLREGKIKPEDLM